MRIPFLRRKEKKNFRRSTKIEPNKSRVVQYTPSKKRQQVSSSALRERKVTRPSLLSRIKFINFSFSPKKPDISLGRFVVVFPIAMTLIIIGFGVYLHQLNVFLISSVEIQGNEEISDLQILGSIGDLRGESMFQVAGSDIEQKLLTDFPYIRNVYVKKRLPGGIEIDIEERFPEFVYINLSGAYLIDGDYIVVEVLGLEEARELTDRERLILDGLGDPEADYVLVEYISAVEIEDDSELNNLDWSKVSDEDKQRTLEEIKRGLEEKRDQLIENKSGFLVRGGFAELNRAIGFDADIYEVGDEFPSIILDYSLEIKEFLTEQNLTVRKTVWKSDFTININTTGRLVLLFTSTRSLADQFNAFQTVRNAKGINSAKLIDLRSEIVSVR